MKMSDNEKISAITQMMNKVNKVESTVITESYEHQRTVGEKTYVVVRHKNGYLIKEKLGNGKTAFINGEKNITKYFKKTLNEAKNYVNLLQEKKYVLKTDDESSDDMGMNDGGMDMGSDMDTDMGADLDLGDEDMDLGDEGEDDDEQGEPIEADLEEYQQLSGKLAYILKQESSPDKIKYIFNTLIASISVDDENKDAIEKAANKLTDKMGDTSSDEGEGDEDMDETDQDDGTEGMDDDIKETVKRNGYIVEGKYTKKQMIEMLMEKKKRR